MIQNTAASKAALEPKSLRLNVANLFLNGQQMLSRAFDYAGMMWDMVEIYGSSTMV